MKFSIMVASLLIFLVGLPQEEKQPVFYIKHLEAPLHYPRLRDKYRFKEQSS